MIFSMTSGCMAAENADETALRRFCISSSVRLRLKGSRSTSKALSILSVTLPRPSSVFASCSLVTILFPILSMPLRLCRMVYSPFVLYRDVSGHDRHPPYIELTGNLPVDELFPVEHHEHPDVLARKEFIYRQIAGEFNIT